MNTRGSADGLPDGTPCWLEVATAEPAETMRFYGEVLGWQFETRADGAGNDYVIATLLGQPVAGVVTCTEWVRDWTVYLSTAEPDRAQWEAARLGGAILSRTTHLPGVGLKVLADDAGGATVGLCRPGADWTFAAGMPGALVWAELVTARAALADEFFGRVFGYELRQFGDGRSVDYTVWYAGEDSVIGRVRMPPGNPGHARPHWIAHFAVDPRLGFDAALQRAEAAGARLLLDPYPSSIGQVAVLADPLGTRFALIDPDLATEVEYGAANDDPYDD